MNVKEFLSPTHVLADFVASSKRALLQGLAQRAADSLKLPTETISSALLKREELGPTGTGDGIAIPHARIPGLDTNRLEFWCASSSPSILTRLMTNRSICCSCFCCLSRPTKSSLAP